MTEGVGITRVTSNFTRARLDGACRCQPRRFSHAAWAPSGADGRWVPPRAGSLTQRLWPCRGCCLPWMACLWGRPAR